MSGIGPVVVAALLSFPVAAAEQTASSVSSRYPGHDRLEPLVGRWTIVGREATHLQVCEWFQGRFQVVCKTEAKGPDGSTTGMGIFGYLPEENVYTYYGMGSAGRNEALRGTWMDGTFVFMGEMRSNGKVVKTRVTVGPFTRREMPVKAESSTENGPWIVDVTLTHRRLE